MVRCELGTAESADRSSDAGSDRRAYLLGVGAAMSTIAGCTTGTDDDRAPPEEVTPDREPYTLAPGEYDTIAIFRNDDPHPGYRIEALRNLETVFIEANVPVTHGVIPAAPDNAIADDSEFCREFRRRDARYPGLFEYSVHGYTHQIETAFYGGSEFGDRPFETQRELVADGISKVADCVDRRPTTFIPPANTYDEATVRAILEEDLRVVSGGEWFTRQYYGDHELPFEAGGALHVPSTHDVVADWGTLEFLPLEEMKAAFDDVEHLYVCMLHYQHFTTEERIEYLEELVEYVDRDDRVGCMTLESFGRAYLDGTLTELDGGWEYSPE